MRSSRSTFAVCLIASLAIHLAIFQALKRFEGNAEVAAPKPPTPNQPVVPDLVPLPPAPKLAFGEKAGIGDANNSSPGDVLQSSPLSRPDQAALTRDPTGQASEAAPPKPLSQPVTTPPPAEVPTPPASKLLAFRRAEKPSPRDAQPPPDPKPEPSQQPAKEAAPSRPPQDAVTAGRPMPQSDQDSDPFAKEQTLEFKAGRVVARQGRQVKFARPRTNLSAMVEAAEISFPARLRLRVSIDATGRVREAVVATSSGSSSIDRAFVLAAYESWFEPAKDAAGKPVADQMTYTIILE
ncbi:MAG TPA: energy transducer TonB [Tepidisphaeraceae bacterium]|jgi:TonB family protein